jgi:hypothetical protein
LDASLTEDQRWATFVKNHAERMWARLNDDELARPILQVRRRITGERSSSR